MKIYVVTKGEYSDYHILTATTDKDLAEAIRTKFYTGNSWDECRIEEYENADIYMKDVYCVRFNQIGNVYEVEKADSSYDYAWEKINTFVKIANPSVVWDGYIYVQADTQEAAIKIASEKRAEFLARKAGIC